MSDLSLFENQLTHMTLRIHVLYKDGKEGFGTGFYFRFPDTDGNSRIVLITNRHVVENWQEIFLTYTPNVDGMPKIGESETIRIPPDYRLIFFHPDNSVDLALISVAPMLEWGVANNLPVYFKAFVPDQIFNGTNIDRCRAVEDILMVGYPNSLWDEKNNYPIIRRGITATPLYSDYNGKPEFMIDAACFPGSSGSPVMMYRSGVITKNGEVTFGTEALLAGILYAGPTMKANGSIRQAFIPTKTTSAEDIYLMLNLGYCIKADQILAFEGLLKDWDAARNQTRE